MFGLFYVIGVGLGLVSLLGFLHTQGMAVRFLEVTFASKFTITGDAAQYVVIGDEKVKTRVASRLEEVAKFYGLYTRGISYLILLIYGFISLAILAVSRSLPKNSLGIPGFILVLAVPPFMLLLGRYPKYYTWMGFMVLLLVVANIITSQDERSLPGIRRIVQYLGIIAFLLASIIGLPINLLQDSKSGGEKSVLVDEFVAKNVSPEDWVYGESIIFYATKKHAGQYFSLAYAGGRRVPKIPEKDVEQINKLIIRPSSFKTASKKVAKNWVAQDTLIYKDLTLVAFKIKE